MSHLRHAGSALATVLTGAAIVTACSGGPVGAATAPRTAASVAAPAGTALAPDGAEIATSHGGGGHKPKVTLPADWPTTAVPLPAGTLTAASGFAPRWSVLLLVSGSATNVQRSSMAFYTSRGWAKFGPNGVRKGHYRIGIGAVNRDHTATSTNLTIAVAKV